MPLRCLGGHTRRVPGLRMLLRCGFVCLEEHFEGLDGQGDLRGLFVPLEGMLQPNDRQQLLGRPCPESRAVLILMILSSA